MYLCSAIIPVAISTVAVASICLFLALFLALGDRRYHTEDATTAKSPSGHGLSPSSPQTTKDAKSKGHVG